ncbi:MAG: biotin/lipoyl-containing protein [Bacteroidota bacterium]
MSAKISGSGDAAQSSKPEKKKKGQDPVFEDFVIGESVYRTTLTRKFRERKTWERPNEKEIRAFIPGTIREILVKKGQKIVEGDPLLRIEAMKMLNTVASPLNGVVEQIHVKMDEQVAKNVLLLTFQ